MREGREPARFLPSKSGTPRGTSHAQVCHARKYFEGTYAARLRFSDTPVEGPDGDVVVQTFYAVSPLRFDFDPEYSELDWEYLPNGGWGMSEPTLWTTTWETASLDPWIADNVTLPTSGALGGWHTLVIQVANGSVGYFLDGAPRVVHGGRYYPEAPMSLNYTAWFVDGGSLAAGPTRRYVQDVDWAFQATDSVLSPQQVVSQVAAFRKGGVKFRDTVPTPQPPLDSPCNF